MEVFFEVLKYTLPSTIVFLTVYFLLRQYFDLEKLKFQTDRFSKTQKDSLPIRLQAYERLSLFLERIRITNLIIRFPYQKDTNSKAWLHSLMLAIQQEYEHNMSMQVYVSEKLWEILSFARNESLNAILEAMNQSDNSIIDADLLMNSNPSAIAEQSIDTALAAIRKEAQLYL
ncbi:MAG: hypothetical protein IPO62_16370 [Saprospiraceae bacterium]|nr:hypothetical protein [Saprospiraceae bacterium]MBK9632602.1 hypothetical protein [Saprospiraceae bacterium]